MSPQVSNFVHELVDMAKAVELVPQLQAEVDRLSGQVESYAKQVQDREMAIISYKQDIETLTSKVRSLEVERDDAGFRALEAEDLVHEAISSIDTMQSTLGKLKLKLDLPKPQPEPEPVKEPVPEVATPYYPLEPTPIPMQAAEGQGEANPTSVGTTAEPQASPADPDPEPQPKWTYEWYSWNDRRNEREAKRVASTY